MVAVDASSNRSKGKRDPTGWVPKDHKLRCDYVETWIDLKIRWELGADKEEVAALEKHVEECGW